ncbi:MAG: glycosyl hydrolase family 8 [Cyanobacteria bacterium P01_H01_bin.74]
MKQSWTDYKAKHITNAGQIIDLNTQTTTSEGQAYALLAALWVNDRETFDLVWGWTQANLRTAKSAPLFVWQWGKGTDGQQKITDQAIATDADQDIALALLIADKIWKAPAYRQEALSIIEGLWAQFVKETPAGFIVLPGHWAKQPETQPDAANRLTINPSYFAPYAYAVFAEVDPEHPWQKVIEDGYQLLGQVLTQTKTGLPSDWAFLDLHTPKQGKDRVDSNAVQLFTDPLDERSDFGYEALRVYWRLSLDQLLQQMTVKKTSRTQQRFLNKNLNIKKTPLWEALKHKQPLPLSLTWDGSVRYPHQNALPLAGSLLPALNLIDKKRAATLQHHLVIPALLDVDRLQYYSYNWLWFGMALSHQIDDVTGSNLLLHQSALKALTEIFTLHEQPSGN